MTLCREKFGVIVHRSNVEKLRLQGLPLRPQRFHHDPHLALVGISEMLGHLVDPHLGKVSIWIIVCNWSVVGLPIRITRKEI